MSAMNQSTKLKAWWATALGSRYGNRTPEQAFEDYATCVGKSMLLYSDARNNVDEIMRQASSYAALAGQPTGPQSRNLFDALNHLAQLTQPGNEFRPATLPPPGAPGAWSDHMSTAPQAGGFAAVSVSNAQDLPHTWVPFKGSSLGGDFPDTSISYSDYDALAADTRRTGNWGAFGPAVAHARRRFETTSAQFSVPGVGPHGQQGVYISSREHGTYRDAYKAADDIRNYIQHDKAADINRSGDAKKLLYEDLTELADSLETIWLVTRPQSTHMTNYTYNATWNTTQAEQAEQSRLGRPPLPLTSSVDPANQCIMLMDELIAEFNRLLAEDIADLQQIIAPLPAGPGRAGYQQQLDALRHWQAQVAAGGIGTVLTQVVFLGDPVKRTFKEQCFLLSHLPTLAKWKHDESVTAGSGLRKRVPYHSIDIKRQYVGTSTQKKANACIQIVDKPWGFMNKLTQSPTYGELFDIRNHHLSQLSPMIRLFKIVTDENGIESEVEFKFDATPSGADLQDLLRTKTKRGFGVGIRDFDFTYHGSDPFAVKKSIKAKLVIFASSFDELIKARPGVKTYRAGTELKQEHIKYRYADLALKTGNRLREKYENLSSVSEVIKDNLEKLNFRLKAVVGWAKPPGTHGFSADLLKAIDDSFVTLNLTPTVHEFDIDDMGRVTFTINYLAYADEFFDSQHFNIFSDPEIARRMHVRKLDLAFAEADCTSGGAKGVEALRKTQKDEIDRDKEESLKILIQTLLDRAKVLFLPIKFEDINKFNNEGPFIPMKQYGDPLTLSSSPQDQANKDMFKRLQRRFQRGRTSSSSLTNNRVEDTDLKEYINFFFLSDLIDVVLELLDESFTERIGAVVPAGAALADEKASLKGFYQNYKRFRIVLGPLEVRDVTNPSQMHVVSLGSLPISVAYFMEWLTDRVLALNRVSYSLTTFLKDLLNNLVRNFLNADTCYKTNIKQKTRLFSSVLTTHVKKDKASRDELSSVLLDTKTPPPVITLSNLPSKKHPLPLLNVMGERGTSIAKRSVSEEFNYVVFYAGRTQPSNYMNGSQKEDHPNGIFHFILGKDRGIVKNISLTKTNSPGLPEVRYEQEGYDGLSQLRVVYDATVTCYGSPNIVPGTYIYIDPRGFSPNTNGEGTPFVDAYGNTIDAGSLTRYGVGGYYMIITAENSLGAGKSETVLTAKWVAALGAPPSRGTLTSTPSARKCGT
jgi:hypothetical protein